MGYIVVFFAALLHKIKELSKAAKVRIIDNLISRDSEAALSANMGYELNQRITNSWDGSKYLSLWDATTGKPVKDPVFMPYEYDTGMFYIVDFIAEEGGTNYKPSGTEYTGEASTEIESETLEIGQKYRYNGTEWELQQPTSGVSSFSELTGDPEDNTALAASLNEKLDKRTNTTADEQVYIKKADGTQDVRSATPNASPNKYIYRDANARAKVANPSDALDIANKGYADNMLNMSGTGTHQGAVQQIIGTDSVTGEEVTFNFVVKTN